MDRRPLRPAKLIAVVASAAGLLLASGAAVHATPPSVAAVCTVNISSGTHNCGGVPGISVQSLSGVELLMKLAFSPGQTATFTAVYGSTPASGDFTVNIGDSESNNGGGGDGSDQSNDAEMMVLGRDMSVFGHDGIPGGKLLLTANNLVSGGSVVSFQVSNDRLCWNGGSFSCLANQWLYALNGQPDSEGPENFDIYAGFNRVVSDSSPSRDGTSVTRVTVSLD